MNKIFPLLLALLFSLPVSSATLLILGDSLSAGYQMPVEKSWPFLLTEQLNKLGKSNTVINSSISGDTTGNGLARLAALLEQHKPTTVLIELGANDGLRGFSPRLIKNNIRQMITLIKAQQAMPLLMQIHVPPNYGKRYTQAFSALYPELSEENDLPLLPFFLEEVIQKPQWMMADGLHPTPQAQPWIAQFMAKQLAPLL